MDGALKGRLSMCLSNAEEMEDRALCLGFAEERWFEEAQGCEAMGIPCFNTVGRHYLKPGDRLTIYDKHDASVVRWSGTLEGKLGILICDLAWIEDEEKKHPLPPPSGVDAAAWHEWFNESYPAELVPAP